MINVEENAARQRMFERRFHVEGLRERIILHIYAPRFEDGEWICEYQLVVPGFDQRVLVPIVGVDKLGAVTSAIRRVKSDISLLAERLGRQVTWLGEPRLDLI